MTLAKADSAEKSEKKDADKKSKSDDKEFDDKESDDKKSDPKADASEKAENTAAPFHDKKTVDDITVSVEANAGVIPKGAKLSVEKVIKKSDLKTIGDSINTDDNIAMLYTFDISILDSKKNEIQPNGDVSVSFSSEKIRNKILDTSVYHIEENKKAGETVLKANELKSKTAEDTCSAVTDGFSYYVLVLTYKDLCYEIENNVSKDLNEIISSVGIAGTITDARVSDEKLLSVVNKNGWTITALNEFDSDEWVKVTVDNAEYQIDITTKKNTLKGPTKNSRGVQPVCKIVDSSGEHPFDSLNAALKFARNGVDPAMSSSNPIAIEMLMDYVIPGTTSNPNNASSWDDNDRILLNQSKDNIIITTAATSGGEYNFTPTFTSEQGRTPYVAEQTDPETGVITTPESGDRADRAILKRGFSGDALFTVESQASIVLQLTNISFDGDKDNGTTGRCVYQTKGTLKIMDDTVMRNFKAANGGAVWITSNAANTIVDKADFSNCEITNTTSSSGGGVLQIDTPCTIKNSVFTDFVSAGYGGALFLKRSNGTVITIDNCTFIGHDKLSQSTLNAVAGGGGAIYV